MRILGISGSLRQDSFNSALIRSAADLTPDGATLTLHDYSAIPLYNDDVYRQGFPAAVREFRQAIRSSDALFFATPEYNRGMPGVLKNAIDWASRPPSPAGGEDPMPLAGKPAAITGVTPGALGAAAGIFQLRHTLGVLGVQLVSGKDVFVPQAKDKFDASGKLTDEQTRKNIADLLARLARLARLLHP